MSLFASAGMAAGYAQSRPPMHPLILEKARPHLSAPVRLAVDIGCGSGLSTRALAGYAGARLGIDPVAQMLAYARGIAPGACFAAAQGESLPLPDRSAGLLTAAGSLNFAADLHACFREARRVLTPEGTLLVYDFSQGNRARDSQALEHWFAGFRQRYPPPAGSARPLSPEILKAHAPGFAVSGTENFTIPLRMNLARYVDYLLTETNVAQAILRGESRQSVRAWCEETLEGVFQGRECEILFPGYYACLKVSNNECMY